MKRLITLFLAIMVIVNVNYALDENVIIGKVINLGGTPIKGVSVNVKNSINATKTDNSGSYSLNIGTNDKIIVFSFPGMKTKEETIGTRKEINVVLEPELDGQIVKVSEECVDYEVDHTVRPAVYNKSSMGFVSGGVNAGIGSLYSSGGVDARYNYNPGFNTEGYSSINESGYKNVNDEPLSTFSIDVDAASYANVRRFLNMGQLPHKDVVRIEEMINYFSYDYPNPADKDAFSVIGDMSSCPWNSRHKLLRVALKGREIEKENLPASNIVFLIDVSGSMNTPNKLPLLKSAFRMFVNQLREQDKVSIVVYAGAAGIVLEPTCGNEKIKIMESLEKLSAGGSTAGGEGLKLAYKVASENFIEGGNNRIMLATDGDFNVGVSSNAEMERLVEKEREKGVFMTVLGFGTGNYKDDKMEIIADKGNGNYAYIDNIQEAKKVLINEFGGTLFTIAKDVKIQIEFNPSKVKAYRLIGYANRLLNKEDFNNDKKDAGELGAGHFVTAFYEIIPAGSDEVVSNVDELKYQKTEKEAPEKHSEELLTIKLRYKEPDKGKSILVTKVISDKVIDEEKAEKDYLFAAAVTEFGLLLSDSQYKGNSNYANVLHLAQKGKGEDVNGYRSEFIRLVKLAMILDKKLVKE
jgi:Ca-activated chloride channel family protein